jgi:hypothetical protein
MPPSCEPAGEPTKVEVHEDAAEQLECSKKKYACGQQP